MGVDRSANCLALIELVFRLDLEVDWKVYVNFFRIYLEI